MAKPAFIYAFDNLGPERFTELCGLLLASRHKGFLLGGVGPDGGIDGEIDEYLGEWQPESESLLLDGTVQPGQQVVFQFKHIVTARAGGQVSARKNLLKLYRSTGKKTCELHRKLIQTKMPAVYVLVTNVEVNSVFRNKFIQQCKTEEPAIEHYQIIGLDELESWVTMQTQLRHQYFPTIFGPPRFDVRIRLDEATAFPLNTGQTVDLFQISVLNMGIVPVYVETINFLFIVDSEPKRFIIFHDPRNQYRIALYPKFGTALEPGRKQTWSVPFSDFAEQMDGNHVFPAEVIITDEIGNEYREQIPEKLRDRILSCMTGQSS